MLLKLPLQICQRLLKHGVLAIRCLRLRSPARNQVRLRVALVAVALCGELPVGHAAIQPLRLGLHLAQRRSGVCRLPLRLPTLVGFAIHRGAGVGDLSCKRNRLEISLR